MWGCFSGLLCISLGWWRKKRKKYRIMWIVRYYILLSVGDEVGENADVFVLSYPLIIEMIILLLWGNVGMLLLFDNILQKLILFFSRNFLLFLIENTFLEGEGFNYKNFEIILYFQVKCHVLIQSKSSSYCDYLWVDYHHSLFLLI